MQTFLPKARRAVLALAALSALSAFSAGARAELVIGLTSTNALMRFDSAAPSNAFSGPVNITNLVSTSEQILGIDRRPIGDTLYGLSNSGRLYTLDSFTGQATLVSQISGATLSGTSFGIDFNPTVDRLRIVSNTGQNLRVNVETGAATVDTALNGGSTSIVASAYTNNLSNATTTALYGIDSGSDALYLQSPPNNGTQTLVGALGVNTIGVAGFDISGATGVAYAALTSGDTGKSGFYTVNLATGSASLVGAFGVGGNLAVAPPLLGIAVSAVPEPGTWALFALGLGTVLARSRRSRRTT